MQWGNVGGIAGLYTQDYDLIGRSSWWNRRTLLCADTWFWSNQKKRLWKTVLGSGISGSGPSIFALRRKRHCR
jgi:hypothetical protein